MKFRYLGLIGIITLINICAAKAQIYGVVVGNDENRLAFAWVTAFFQNEMAERVRADEDGNFVFQNLPTGVVYDFVVQKNGQNRMFPKMRPAKNSLFIIKADFEHSDQLSMTQRTTADVNIDLNRFEWWLLPATDGFDFPFESGEIGRNYCARYFGTNNHLGEDWNGPGGGDRDLGTPIHSIADGIVIFAGYGGPGWGYVVRVLHNAGTRDLMELNEAVYAHLEGVHVREGQLIVRGQQIGTMGNAGGKYQAHLHLELRDRPGMPLGGGYKDDFDGFVSPYHYIAQHRPTYKETPAMILDIQEISPDPPILLPQGDILNVPVALEKEVYQPNDAEGVE